jgi:mannose-1-phosphate guanylyltransferase
MTADHCIRKIDCFEADCRAAFEQAEAEEVLVTFGVTPTRPDTGFGYLELGERVATRDGSEVFAVRRYREKPNAETARGFLEAGNFVWNSGMFVWRASVLRQAMRDHSGYLARAAEEMAVVLGTPDETRQLAAIFEDLPKISIDFAVMERADNVRCVRARFDWDDVGTWSSLARLHETDADKNVILARAVPFETARSIIYSDEGDEGVEPPLVATLGVEDVVIVVTGDAILVCHRDQTQRLKELLKRVREKYGESHC